MKKGERLRSDGAGGEVGGSRRGLVVSFAVIFAGIVGGMYLIEAFLIGPETEYGGLIALGASSGAVLLGIEIARRTRLGRYLPVLVIGALLGLALDLAA